MKNKNILFYTASESIYDMFIMPYTFSHLHFNKNSKVEISILGCEQYIKNNPKEIEFLEKYFKGRYLFREARIQTFGSLRRIVEKPDTKAEIVHIGDVDIFCLKDDVYEHSMKVHVEENLMTANIVRVGWPSISGCGTYKYEFFDYAVNYWNTHQVPNDVYWDERLIYAIFKENNFKMPPIIANNDKEKIKRYRCLNGFHTSLNRNGVFDYCDNLLPEQDYKSKFNEFKNTSIYIEFLKIVNENYKTILNIINQNV